MTKSTISKYLLDLEFFMSEVRGLGFETSGSMMGVREDEVELVGMNIKLEWLVDV